MNNPIQNQINTVFVHVRDLKKAVKWYGDLLGQSHNLDTVADPVHNIQVNHHTYLTLDAGPSEITKEFTSSPYPLFNLHSTNIDDAFNYVTELGYQIDSDITRFDDVSFFNVKDPDGNVIMICEG